MKRRVFVCMLLLCLGLLYGCDLPERTPVDGGSTTGDAGASDPATDVENTDAQDPATVHFFEDSVTAAQGEKITLTVVNNTAKQIITESSFLLTDPDGAEAGRGTATSVTVEPGQQAKITLDPGTVEPGEYFIVLRTNVSDLRLALTVTAAERDILTLPLEELTDAEVQELGKYLCDTYAACSVGLFESMDTVSSNSIWSTIQYLNLVLYNDTSAQSRTVEDAKQKAALFFEGANFVPEDVRMYDKKTGTFLDPGKLEINWKYDFLSAEVKNGTIAVRYKDQMDGETEAGAGEYETVLKHNGAGGFTYVSSVRTNPVG